MKQLVTTAIVLSRTDFGEADRIVTLLTPDKGKVRVMARGVRKIKSKLAGGIELFSISEITYIPGRGDLNTLVSTRMIKHYGNIVKDITRVQLGYDLIKVLHKATEDEPGADYFNLMEQSFKSLDDATINTDLIRLFFYAQLLQAGHSPNLVSDTEGNKLVHDKTYDFDFDNMTFSAHPNGHFTAPQIKVLRLLFDGHAPVKLQQVNGVLDQLPALTPLVRTMLTSNIRI